jgi:hypothetical protein
LHSAFKLQLPELPALCSFEGALLVLLVSYVLVYRSWCKNVGFIVTCILF